MELSKSASGGKAELGNADKNVGEVFDLLRAIKCLTDVLEREPQQRIPLCIAIRHLTQCAQDFINDVDVAIERAEAVLQ